MLNRGHLDPLELDEFLLGRRDEIVDTYHVNTCRACREALLDLTVMAGLARGAPFKDPLEGPEIDPDAGPDAGPKDSDRDVEAGSASPEPGLVCFQRDRVGRSLADVVSAASDPPPARPLFSRKLEVPMHLSASDMDALLRCAFEEDSHDAAFLPDLRHLKGCDLCLGRFLRLARGDMPSARSIEGIVQALKGGPKADRQKD